MNRIFHMIRPQIARLAQARAVPVPVAVIGLLLAAGLNLVSVRPSAALSLRDLFPAANRIVLICDLVRETTETITISESAFCEIAKTAIESLAQGKISPRVTRVRGWEHALEPDWPKRCRELPSPAIDCGPSITEIIKLSSYLQVSIESRHTSLHNNDPTVLIIKFIIRATKNEQQEMILWYYNILLENKVADEVTARILQQSSIWPGGVVHPGKTIPTRELIDEIQVTLASQFSPHTINMLNSRASNK